VNPEIRAFEYLWLSNIHPRACGEEDEAGAFKGEGNICVVQRDLKGLQDLHTSATKDSGETRC
jgi:hypothetical protein